MPLFVSGFVMYRSSAVLLEALCSAIYEVKSNLNLAELKSYPSLEHLHWQLRHLRGNNCNVLNSDTIMCFLKK